MHLSLNQAAKETGKSKATISKYIREGKLSVIEKSDSGYKIDPAELFRVFDKNPATSGTRYHSRTPDLPPVTPAKNEEIIKLELELKAALREIEALKEDKDDYKKRLDQESEERRKLTMMITDMRDKSTQKLVEDNKSILWWRRTKN